MDSLAAFDADLQAKLGSVDPSAQFGMAFAVLAKHSLRDAVLLAARFLALREISDGRELQMHPERMDRRLEAAKLLQENTSLLTAEELARAVATGGVGIDGNAIYTPRAAALLLDHPDLQTPERKFACLVAIAEESAKSPHPYSGRTLMTWLCLRLCETPYVEGAARLAELHRAGRIPADVVGATGDRALLEELAPQSLACAFALDPKTAFDRFGDRLTSNKPGPDGVRGLLAVLAQDGFSTHGLSGKPSTNPQGWLRADERWIAPLMALRESNDPNISWPAADALGNCDLEKVLALLPKPKKKIPALEITSLGTVAAARRLWLGAKRLFVIDGGREITAHALEPGLPVAARFELPEGVELQEEGSHGHDDPWERPGLYDVAVRADGGIAIGAQTKTFVHLVALYDASGKRVALREIDESAGSHPHSLVFGAGGAGSLWVALVHDVGHRAAAFAPTDLAPKGHCLIGKEFPSPALFHAGTHPTDDVGIFDVACGQDGAWLPVVEVGAKGPQTRKHKLSGKQTATGFAGAGASNAVFATWTSTMTLRAWPTLETPKKKRLDGSVVGAGVVDGAIAFAVAEVSNEPSAIELRRIEDGERLGKARYPLGEKFRAFGAGVLVTSRRDGSLNVHRVSV